MKITVIGGGNGAYAAAADMAEKGHSVRLWRRNKVDFKPILESQSINLKDIKGLRRVKLDLASSNLAEVVQGAELIIIPLPAPAQAALAIELAPYLHDGQVILLTPGTFGSYVMAKALRQAGCQAKLIFAETGTLPYLARKHGHDTVAITTRATRLPTGVFPSEQADYAFELLKKAFPAIEPLQDALDGALMNAGPIIHPPLIILNAGPIEHFSHWDIHNEGTQPSVRKVHTALDNERIAIRMELGYGPPHFPLADHYDQEGDEWMYGNSAHEKLVDSADWREELELKSHRYMCEDVAMGLAFLVSLGQWAGVPVPVADSLLTIASTITGNDLRKVGRTMENIQLAGINRDQMKLLLKRGILE